MPPDAKERYPNMLVLHALHNLARFHDAEETKFQDTRMLKTLFFHMVSGLALQFSYEKIGF